MSEFLETDLVNGLTCALPASSPLARQIRSQRTWRGPDAKQRQRILRQAESIAIVGFSPNPARSSHFVGTYLASSSDYRLYFVNPVAAGQVILGQPVYASLADLPEVPDIVDVFRRPAELVGVIDDAVALGSPIVWIQLGIWDEEAAAYAESLGRTVVMDRCIKIEHARFHGGLHLAGFDTGQITARPVRHRHRPVIGDPIATPPPTLEEI